MQLNYSFSFTRLNQYCRNSAVLGEMKKNEQLWTFGNKLYKTTSPDSFNIRSSHSFISVVNKIIETALKIFFYIGKLVTGQSEARNLKRVERFAEGLKKELENVPTDLSNKDCKFILEKLNETQKNLVMAANAGLINYKDTFLEEHSGHMHEVKNSQAKRVQALIDKLHTQILPLLNGKMADLKKKTLETDKFNATLNKTESIQFGGEVFAGTSSEPPPIPKIAFGKEKWLKYFGEIGDEPPLPHNINEILAAPCRVFPGKTVGETHVLVLIPKTVNGASLTVTQLLELVKTPGQGGFPTHPYICHFVSKAIGALQISKESCWVLMTKDVIPNSTNKSFEQQEAMLAELAAQSGLNYEYPSGPLATACTLLEYVRSGIRAFGGGNKKDPTTWTFTLCKENASKDWKVVVGGFTQGALVIDHGYDNCELMGVAAIVKL